MKIRKGDTIIVTTGKDKGKKEKWKNVSCSGISGRPGVNVYKRHKKKQGEKQAGGIIESRNR